MNRNRRSVELTKNGFEESFKEGDFYNKQTRDDFHLESILKFVEIKPGMKLLKSFDSEIRFPKKKATAGGLEEIIEKHDKSIIDSYKFEITEEEIWVTEEVNNILFVKG